MVIDGFDEPAEHLDAVAAIRAAMTHPDMRHWHRTALDAVVRWQPAAPGTRLGHPEPFDRELYGKGVRLLAERPADATTPYEEYGYDADGELRAARLPVLAEAGELECLREQSFFPVPVGTFVFDHEWRRGEDAESAFGASLIREDEGRVVERIDLYAPSGGMGHIVSFHWEDDRPVGLTRYDAFHERDGTWEMHNETHARCDYDAAGPTQIVEVRVDVESIWWKRPAAKPTSHASLVRRWKRALLRAVPALLQDETRLANRGPLHAVALLYSNENPYLVNTVALWAPQADVARDTGFGVDSYWNAADALSTGAATLIEHDRDPELRELAADLYQVRENAPIDAAELEQSTLLSVAATLNRRAAAWNEVDRDLAFLVWPAETETENLRSSLDQVLTRKQLARLGAAGNLPDRSN